VLFKKNDNQTTIVPKTTFTITINNPNGTKLKEFNVVTSDFGSFFGEFVLPTTGLTGNFRIQAEEPDEYEKRRYL
jgi:uncharacterized protein YfaS (alpha-2-macroglobulin family)